MSKTADWYFKHTQDDASIFDDVIQYTAKEACELIDQYFKQKKDDINTVIQEAADLYQNIGQHDLDDVEGLLDASNEICEHLNKIANE